MNGGRQSLAWLVAQRQLWRGALVVLIVAVSWLAFAPVAPSDTVAHIDKLSHVFAFTVLTVVACWAWAPSGRRLVAVALALMAYGAFIELVQMQLPSREASWIDWAADALGIVLGWGLALGTRRLA
jgi:VanZ family protein